MPDSPVIIQKDKVTSLLTSVTQIFKNLFNIILKIILFRNQYYFKNLFKYSGCDVIVISTHA